ncbi:hypothetical protein NDU88_000870 [Pleurodeles waltl]|uniref:Uncharacterized protein n=1 Tax=Pleurodeles waltl TaxID=8319 RepID=A0AAV7U4P8_PLEWA|nr:hypothetical protein NDU88_000870 [Pleurodeles waltl]
MRYLPLKYPDELPSGFPGYPHRRGVSCVRVRRSFVHRKLCPIRTVDNHRDTAEAYSSGNNFLQPPAFLRGALEGRHREAVSDRLTLRQHFNIAQLSGSRQGFCTDLLQLPEFLVDAFDERHRETVPIPLAFRLLLTFNCVEGDFLSFQAVSKGIHASSRW